MAASLYLASMEPDAGKSLVALGLMEVLTGRLGRVGYFRPVVADDAADERLALVRGRYDPELPDEQLAATTHTRVQSLLADGRGEEVFKEILERHRAIGRDHDVILVDGTDYTGVSAALEFDFNAQLATHLGAVVCSLVNGRGKALADIVDAVRLARESLATHGCRVAMTIVNRVDAEALDDTRRALAADLERGEPVFALPETASLARPTVGEVLDALDGRLLRGDADDRHREIASVRVAAMSLPNFLDRLTDGALVVTPGDRPDIILGSLVSQLSPTHPTIAGLVLTGGFEPAPQISALLDGLAGPSPPVVAVDTDTHATVEAIGRVKPTIHADNPTKVATALGVFECHVDADSIVEATDLPAAGAMTPLMFEYELVERARRQRTRVVLPEGTDKRILAAAERLDRRDIVDLVLLGNVDEVRARMTELGVDLAHLPIVDPATAEETADYAERYHELRRHRGVELDQARDVMLDVSYFGTMMVHTGAVDGMVSGAMNTTGHTIRPAFEFIRAEPGVSVVSSVFFMCLPDRVLVYADCAINPNPDAPQLADIAVSSAETARRFGIHPRVAMLSYSTGTSGAGRDVDKVREATELARQRAPDVDIEGPIQYDAAVDASVAEAKMPGSAVAGRASVFVFPDLNTGNNTYKAVQRSAGAVAIGPILQGLNKPVNDLSRGCSVPDVVNTVAITAIQAQQG